MKEIKKILIDITKFGFRQFENELKTRKYILDLLKKSRIEFKIQNFYVELPKYEKYFLIIDKKKVKCYPSTLSSGYIKDKTKLHNSLVDFENLVDEPNINFNPLCKDISLPTIYKSPALSIGSKDVIKLLNAKRVLGYVKTKRARVKVPNIIVGNLHNPKNIIFTHYDSLFKGAIDNASGVAICLYLLKNNKFILANNLFVFSGNEELSYKRPIYWGFGYRMFEKEYLEVLRKAEKILVVDSVGHTAPKLIKDQKIIELGLPLKNLKKLNNVYMISGDIKKLMDVYHSDLDNIKLIKDKFLYETYRALLKVVYP